MKEATVAQLAVKLQSYQQAAPTPQLPLESLALESQITEMKYKMKQIEYKKQQADLERNTVVQEMKAKQECEIELHGYLGKVGLT